MSTPTSALETRAFLPLVEHLLSRGVQVRFRVFGWSMHPAIRSGDLISVAAIEPSDAARGDILLYRAGLRVVAHRVVAVGHDPANPTFVLRGDATSSDDAPITREHVLGRVVAVKRQERWQRLDTVWARFVRPFSARVRRRLFDHRRPFDHRTGFRGLTIEQRQDGSTSTWFPQSQ